MAKLFSGLTGENIRISLSSVRNHGLRTTLTILIIAFGIMALVGILTSIDAIKYYLNDNFQTLGANTFTIQNRPMRVQIGGQANRPKNFTQITYNEAMRFKNEFSFPARTSVYLYATRTATIKFSSQKTNPNVPIIGTDEEYLATSGFELENGRNITASEVFYGSNVAVLGNDVAQKIFKNNKNIIGKIISISSVHYEVVGILKSKGSSMGFNPDNLCIVPLNNVRQLFSRPNVSYSINVTVPDGSMLESAVSEASGFMRVIRKAKAGDEDNFDVQKSDNLANMLFENLKYLRLAATIIGLITLFGAAIGLMNIMLVSVTERTREIGIRKAVGATRKTIRNQFLVEAIVIGQLGGLFGIIFGILIGNILSLIIGSSFIIPWGWIGLGFILCFVVALISGFVPAAKAANLDPIESLRYE